MNTNHTLFGINGHLAGVAQKHMPVAETFIFKTRLPTMLELEHCASIGWVEAIGSYVKMMGRRHMPRSRRNSVLDAASLNGHTYVMRILLSNKYFTGRHGVHPLANASAGGFITAMKLVDARSLNIRMAAMCVAVHHGKLPAMKWLRLARSDLSVNDLNQMMQFAATNENIRAMKLIRKWILSDWYPIIYDPAPKVTKLIRQWTKHLGWTIGPLGH